MRFPDRKSIAEYFQSVVDDCSTSSELLRPDDGWIRTIRLALGMPAAVLAQRMGVGRAQIGQMERMECEDRITLRQLRRAAAALDCELQYRLVPRRSWSAMLAAQAERKARALVEATDAQLALSGAPRARASRDDDVAAEAADLLRRLPRDFWSV